VAAPVEHQRFPVGISACLLGEPVRYDGGHKESRWLTEVLAPYVRWVSVCPELELGLGVPRPMLHLERAAGGPRLVETATGRDLTGPMRDYARRRVAELSGLGLRGFVLKADSPSCGLARVKVYDGSGVPAKNGVGLFAAALAAAMPSLPIEEEGRLEDLRRRENFVARLFAYDRWLSLRAARPAPGDLVRFHTAHKMQLLAHSPRGAQQLGRLVAGAGATPAAEWPALLDAYEAGFMAALRRVASPGRHVNTLQHLAGFLKDRLTAAETRELAGLIEEYRAGTLPLIAALTLLAHHLKALEQPWVEAQSYLAPYPRELGLRSAI
jgi:uncharacterized protein YbgA (DUF1722 family)/uncharacterized protein YbbK (DUF523 family)